MPSATDGSGLPDKTFGGSDFPYRVPRVRTWEIDDTCALRGSFALGGFSTVWGAAVLPFTAAQMAAWPIGIEDLRPHYAAIAEVVPTSGVCGDALDATFVDLPTNPRPLAGVRATEAMASRLTRDAVHLGRRGLIGGRARLAVDAGDGPNACTYEGACLAGCPRGAIFDAGDMIAAQATTGAITYVGGTVVQRLTSVPRGVVLDLSDLTGGSQRRVHATHVLLAAGVLGTADIILRSQGAGVRVLRALDSQYFLAPLVRLGAQEIDPHAVALSHLFLEVEVSSSGEMSHLQVYPPNALLLGVLSDRLGVHVARRAIRHVMGLQGFLPSSQSGVIDIRLGRAGTLAVSARPNPESGPAARRVLRRLVGAARQLGGVPVAGQMVMAPVGRGFHSGGTLPMTSDPAVGGTDTLGSPPGLPRVHIVDSSVFPTIPGGTITYTVMANSHRIASGVPL